MKKGYNVDKALVLDPEGEQLNAELGPQKCFEVNIPWIKGISVLEKENIIFTWSQYIFTVHDLGGKLIYQNKSLTEYENFITGVVYNQ